MRVRLALPRKIAIVALMLQSVLLAGCGGAEAPDGSTIPDAFKTGRVKSRWVEDEYERPLSADEIRALSVFLRRSTVHETPGNVADAAPVRVCLDGKWWVVYHSWLYQEEVGRSRVCRVEEAPDWANKSHPRWNVLVDWAKKQPEWAD